MANIFSLLILMLSAFTTFAQTDMKPVDELINKTEPAWPIIQGWINSSKNKVEILSRDSVRAKRSLFLTQVTTRSPMGAIIFSTGGLLIDDGWIRILGSGNTKLNRSLPDWNKGKSFKEFGERPAFILIADDVIGGFFAINGGTLGKDEGKVYYMAPDNLEWESLGMTYTDFLRFCFNGNLNIFYDRLRWQNWRQDVSKLDGNSVYSFVPFLWTKGGKDINNTSRKAVPIEEGYNLNLSMRKELGIDKK